MLRVRKDWAFHKYLNLGSGQTSSASNVLLCLLNTYILDRRIRIANVEKEVTELAAKLEISLSRPTSGQ